MSIEFYFDPSCPFCWITSRWLLQVSQDRQLDIDWRPFSLAIKNGEIGADGLAKDKKNAWHVGAHKVLRVMLAAQSQAVSLLDLYTAFGISHHLGGSDFDDDTILSVLKQLNLPASLLLAANDKSYDKQLEDSIQSAIKVAGQDIGVPTIVFKLSKNKKSGFFGPILQTLPTKEEALKLWDSLSVLATNPDFYELKRTRPDTEPDVYSTSHC